MYDELKEIMRIMSHRVEIINKTWKLSGRRRVKEEEEKGVRG